MVNGIFHFCSVIKCPAINPPANGLVGACSLNYQGTCSVSCADGYVRHGGDETRTCLLNKRWSGVPPTCRGMYPSQPICQMLQLLTLQIEIDLTFFQNKQEYFFQSTSNFKISTVIICLLNCQRQRRLRRRR